jgi:hypothetical protein
MGEVMRGLKGADDGVRQSSPRGGGTMARWRQSDRLAWTRSLGKTWGRRSARARAREGGREGKEKGVRWRWGTLYRRRGREWENGPRAAPRGGEAWGWGLTGGPRAVAV